MNNIENSETNTSPTIPADVVTAALAKWTQVGEQHLIPIIGRSMLPLIQPGDQVLIQHGSADLRRGDVVAFLQQDKIVAHRLLHIRKSDPITTYITKGDNASYFDSPVNASQVVGRVLKIKRGDRWIPIDTPAWRIWGWLIAVGMLGWTTFYGWGRKIKHRLWGKQPDFLSGTIRRSAQRLVAFFLKLIILTATFRRRQ